MIRFSNLKPPRPLLTKDEGRTTKDALLLASALAVLSGCSVVTPLPITPIQIIEGTWPAKTATVTTAAKSYTIVGDTFSYKQLGFSITRASQKDWEFLPANNAVVVRYRSDGPEPRPTLAVQLLSLDVSTLNQQLALVEADLKQKGAGDITKTDRTVAGVAGQQWVFDQKDTTGGTDIEVHNERVYLPIANSLVGPLLALVSIQTATSDFTPHEADFDKMIQSIVLPVPQAGQ